MTWMLIGLAVALSGWRRPAAARRLHDLAADRREAEGTTQVDSPSRLRFPALIEGVRRHRQAIAADGALRRSLPDLVDLLRLAVGAGATPRLALAAASRHAPGPAAPPLVELERRVAAGRPFADELERVADVLGDPVRPLVSVLRAASVDGAPLAPALEQLAGELRADRRRHAEAAARRLPVHLLFPLVLCALPALVLLAIVPLMVGTIGSLRL